VLSCIYTGQTQRQACATVVLVTERNRQSSLYDDLKRHQAAHPDSLRNLSLIGDAAAPGLIADAVYSGHLAARDFEKDAKLIEEDLFRREIISLKG